AYRIVVIRKHIGCIALVICCALCILYACRSGNGNEIPVVAPEDSIEIFRLKDKADSLSWYEPDSAIHLYERSLRLSREKNYNLGITANLSGLGFVSINHARYAKGF